MKINFEKEAGNIFFRVYDFDEKYEKVLELCFYEKRGKAYVKKFSNNIENIDEIKEYYLKNAEEMFSQLGYFSLVPWENALFDFAKMLEKHEVSWWLTGSCAACIRGIEMDPHDVDIMIDSKDIMKINEIFKDYIIEPIVDTKGWLTKDFGVLFLHARIDIATDPHPCLDEPEPIDCGPVARQNLEEVIWRGIKVRVPPIGLQLNANRRRGRIERVKLIEKYMQGLGLNE